MKRVWMACAVGLLALPAAGDEGRLALGADMFMAGETVRMETAGQDDVFLAGESVTLAVPVAGSAHLAGRRVNVSGSAGDVYAAGMDVRLDGAAGGDATLFGYEVIVAAPVAGDLRAAARRVRIEAPVAGSAAIGGDEVTLAAAIEGDVVLSADTLRLGEGARIGGRLVLYEEAEGALDLPAAVIPADRIERHVRPEGPARWTPPMPGPQVSLAGAVAGFLGGVLAVGLIAAFVAAVAPQGLARLREGLLARPFRALWLGFLAMSVPFGAVVVLGLTVVGLLAAPALLIVAAVGGVAGYVVGAYAFGVGLLRLAGRGLPDTLGQRAVAALAGALAAGVLGLIPFLGWLFVLALALGGVGALAEAWFRPRFLAAA